MITANTSYSLLLTIGLTFLNLSQNKVFSYMDNAFDDPSDKSRQLCHAAIICAFGASALFMHCSRSQREFSVTSIRNLLIFSFVGTGISSVRAGMFGDPTEEDRGLITSLWCSAFYAGSSAVLAAVEGMTSSSVSDRSR